MSLLLGGACIAMALALFVVTRRARASALARAQVTAMIFLVALGALAFVDGAGATEALATVATALRCIAALAGFVTAALFFFAFSGSAAASKMAEAPHAAHVATAALAKAEPRSPAAPRIASSPPIATGAETIDDRDLDVEGAPEAGFLGLVSHELRTPLTTMQLLLDRLADATSELTPKQRQLVERLASTATRLTDLVDSILYYARIRSGRLVTSIEPFDLGTLATDAAEELRPLAERKSLDLEANGACEHVSIESDPKLLRLVIVNLVSNAVKFTDRGKVAVSVSSEGDHRFVRVTDSGSGIAATEQKRIFEPFQNLEPTKHKHLPGIGLGLSLARQIVDNLGGRIAVRSEPGKGSTFEVLLPAVARAPTAPVSAP
jgi:signal transduction histidine kinase